MQTLFQSKNAVSFLLANSLLVFYRLVRQNGKHCPISRSRRQRGENKPITILVPSYEYGCVRPFRAGISLIYAGIHEDH